VTSRASCTYLPSTREASTGSDETTGRCTNERGAKHCPKLGGKLQPEDITAKINPKEGDLQVH